MSDHDNTEVDDPRCDVSGNPCGTDTRPVIDGKLLDCECVSCQRWLKTRQSTFWFDDDDGAPVGCGDVDRFALLGGDYK